MRNNCDSCPTQTLPLTFLDSYVCDLWLQPVHDVRDLTWLTYDLVDSRESSASAIRLAANILVSSTWSRFENSSSSSAIIVRKVFQSPKQSILPVNSDAIIGPRSPGVYEGYLIVVSRCTPISIFDPKFKKCCKRDQLVGLLDASNRLPTVCGNIGRRE